MARLFNDAASQYLEKTAAVLTGPPLVMACWFRSDDLTTTQTLMSLSDVDVASQRLLLAANGALAGDPVQLQRVSGGTGGFANTSTGYSANVWHHACGIIATNVDGRAFIDGGSKGTNTTSVTPTGIDRTNIGALNNGGSRTAFMSGRIAEAAIWDLSDWPGLLNTDKADNFEQTALPDLAAGALPLEFPLGLVAYWPLFGDRSPEPDVHPHENDAADYAMTVVGATKADHPPDVDDFSSLTASERKLAVTTSLSTTQRLGLRAFTGGRLVGRTASGIELTVYECETAQGEYALCSDVGTAGKLAVLAYDDAIQLPAALTGSRNLKFVGDIDGEILFLGK